jgi:outer membrane receptor protein involved in Fe transport
VTVASPASAAERHRFAVPAGTLEQAVLITGAQGHANIGFSDGRLGRRSSAGLSGIMTTRQALDRLLAGSGFVATEMRRGTFHIDYKVSAGLPRPMDPSPMQGQEIVVTSSKRGIGLASFTGSALVVPIDGRDSVLAAGGVLGDLASRLPILQTTALGPGRNKLFLRGIADSSFPGPTQSTIGSYFGDTRLLYNGPDPNLRLYDVDRVEVLMGPQGTLYGAGAIGGILRIAPNPPAFADIAGSVQGGIATSRDGGFGHDIGAMVNLPASRDIAVRAVGYQAYEAGYIDDIGRGRDDVNGVAVVGGRLAIRARPMSNWMIDLGAIVQSTRARDLQYATRTSPGPGRRNSTVAQPFDDNFYSGYGTITYDGGDGLHALLTAGVTNRDTTGRYDATLSTAAGPVVYDQSGDNKLFSAEARIWRTSPSGISWIAGLSGILNHDAENRSLGPSGAPRDLIGVDNRTKEAALFGEATVPLPWHVTITAGGRLTYARTDGKPLDVAGSPTFYRGMGHTRFDPSFGFVRPFGPTLSWFGRYGVGFRTGGLAVTPRIGRTAAYQADRINVVETGLRFGDAGRRGISGHASVSYARWTNIQADLVGPNGFPFTANVGNGRIASLEGALEWRPSATFQIGGAVFANRSKLYDPAPAFFRAQGDPLPDTPRFSGSGHIVWRPAGFAEASPQFELASHYIGHSVLGVGPRLSLPQGGYAQIDFGATIPLRLAMLSLRIDNLTDHRGNRFALGNPLLLGREQQYTPLRPRTIRLGFTTRFGRTDGHIAIDPNR